MTDRLIPHHPPRGLVLGAGLVLLAGACTATQVPAAGGQPGAAARYPAYDIGPAVSKPPPTGQLKEFRLVSRQVVWEIAPGVAVPAVAYNGQVPGPTIRVTEGDTVRVTLTNELEQPTSIHWHGLHVPNNQDGVVPFSQPEVPPGQSHTYEFTTSHAGTFMYHPHQNAVAQIDRGLYAPLIIDPARTPPARFDREFTMVLSAWDSAAMPAWTHPMPDGGTMAASPGHAMIGPARACSGAGATARSPVRRRARRAPDRSRVPRARPGQALVARGPAPPRDDRGSTVRSAGRHEAGCQDQCP